MERVNVVKRIQVTNPVMIAGWPGMGNVALGAVEYLIKKAGFERFADIELIKPAIIDSVTVNHGMASLPPPPKYSFYYRNKPDIILFEGETQLPGQDGIDLLNKVLDVAMSLKVSRIFTGAAFPLPTGHAEPSEVFAAVNRKELKGLMKGYGVHPMEGGQISGMNGLLLGYAAKRSIDAVCLLATIPHYAISIPNPKASGAIIQTLERVLNFDVNLAELESEIKEMDEKMSAIEERVKDVFPITDEKPELPRKPIVFEKQLPPSVEEKIEILFREARADKTKASTLKKELDRWDLFAKYEDRFLDLFKEHL